MKALYDVVVVGYGPAGAVLAQLLAKGGMSVLVVDKAADIFDKPRAIGIDHEAMRIFQFCGIAHDLFPNVRTFQGSEWHATDGTVLRQFVPAQPPYALGWPPNMTFLQPQLESMLRASVANTPNIDVCLQTEAVRFAQDDESVTAVLRDVQDGSEHTVRARYLVGADGASSTVREQLGITLEDLQFDEWWVVVDMLRQGEADYGNKNVQFCHPSRPGCYVVGPGDLRRWEFRILPHEDPDEFRDPQRVMAMMAEKVDLSGLKLWRSAVYRFHALVATRWHHGRMFLVGDAAHQTPPHLGQGLVSGLRDAANLAWKIQQVEAGASPALFDTYMAERRPHFHSLVSKAKEFGRVIGILDPQAAQERDARLLQELQARTEPETRQNHIPPLNAGLLVTDDEGAPLAPAGQLFIQPAIRTATGTRFLDDGAQPHWQLLTLGTEPQQWLQPAELAQLESLGTERIAFVDAEHAAQSGPVLCVSEVDGVFQRWMQTHNVQAVLVRPDRYVYGVAADAAGLNARIRQLHARLMAPAA